MRDRVRPLILLPVLAAMFTAPAVVEQLGTGYADVPLAMLVAAGLVASARWLESRSGGWLALAVLFFAGAAATKQEGLLFVAAALAALLVVARGGRRPVALAAAAVAVTLVPWRIFVRRQDLAAITDYDLSTLFDPGYVLGRAGRAPDRPRAAAA